MHQLSKDPEAILSPTMATASSPHRNMTRFELARYLDYCSEMLSLSSKLAALHIQYVRDPVVIAAVNDVETLTSGLAQKIWQKIIILDSETAQRGPGGRLGGSAQKRRSAGKDLIQIGEQGGKELGLQQVKPRVIRFGSPCVWGWLACV